MTLDAGSIGARLVVRHETGGRGPTGGPELTDVVGHLRAVDERTVTIELRDGSLRVVDRRSVVTSKRVPDRPVRRRRAVAIDPVDLMRITSRGWPATESQALGDWEMRWSGGFTGRACSVAVTGSPGLPFDVALGRVRDFYAERDAPALAQVVAGTQDDRRLEAAGWTPVGGSYGGAVVQVADLDPSTTPWDEGHGGNGGPVSLSPVADDAWMSRYGRVDDPATGRAVLEGPDRVAFASIGTMPQAIGRVVVTGEWAGLSAVEVEPAARRQGLARLVVQALLAWAVEQGADKAYLQTMRSNAAAVALYRPFGFVDHHDYLYRRASDS